MRRAGELAGVAGLGGAYWTMMASQSQLLGEFPFRGHKRHDRDREARPRVALTFDDGPNEPFTSRLAVLLQRRGVNATFFQVGKAVARCPEVTAELAAAGHVIGNHSYHHELRRCFTESSISEEIMRTQDVLADAIRRTPRLYRPPWLVRTPATFRVLARHGLTPVSGTFCHPLEVAQCAPARTANRAVARTSPDRIMIFHDGYNGQTADRTRTLDAVERTVDVLAWRGWSFVTVDALLGVTAYREQG